MSLRRYQGWEPRQRVTVTERDEQGRPAQWVIETEPEYDVNERAAWEAWDEWQDAVCPQCGNLRSVCSDPSTPWYPQRTICWATATRENISRRWHAKHEGAQPDPLGFKPTDGTTLWVATADLAPDDDFL